MRIASFQSVRIEQFAGHLVKEFRVVQHFLDFLFRAAVVQERLHFISGNAERFGNAEQVVVVCGRVLVVATIKGIFAPSVLVRRVGRKSLGSDTAVAVDFHNLALLWFENVDGRF